MISRIQENVVSQSPKSVLLLGPRQVGKSTLCQKINPDISINLVDEETFRQHLKGPGLIKRIVASFGTATAVVLIDEIQRIPSMLNTVQSLIDNNKKLKFLLTGSSARKLKRGQANLLPGRVLLEYMPPLLYWEIRDKFDLNKAITIGTLPEIYLQDYGVDILASYVAGYLREEIQAEALTKDLGAYSRFIDLAAELSGQYMNYSKVASDSEINKESIRRYMEILSDTLLVEFLPSYNKVDKGRRARQKEKFIFFDLGVRNSLLGRHINPNFSREELGKLFEQWFILQIIYYNRLYKKNWKLSSYRDAMGVEVDLIIESARGYSAIEIKSSDRVKDNMFKGLQKFESISGISFNKYVIYQGEYEQKFDHLGLAIPYKKFLDEYILNL
ncbi:MAG: AAA family ATPase [gamma proteobacterium symbiont of Taylorina sp.]|nr:AAA family ATPase [gamma proteobacterium symbiont of Taylorina sp.]